MSEIQPRKKLSLGRKTLSTNRTSTISKNLKSNLQAKKDNKVTDFLVNADKDLSAMYKKRIAVDNQITQIEQRLLFAKSEPLQDYLFELKTEDFDLLTQIYARVSRL
jgi:hypothetical protein